MKLKVKPFRESWSSAAYLGPYASWVDRDQVELGLNFGPVILGIRVNWGAWRIDPFEVDNVLRWKLGTSLQNEFGNWRYGLAGEDLKKGTLVEADLAGRIAPPAEPSTMDNISELIYGNVKAAKEVDQYGQNVLGWPEVFVKKGRYFWIHEPPPGAEFQKEAG